MRAPILKFFKYDHLPEHLKSTSKLFADLAEQVDLFPAGDDAARAEKATALRKLLEAKDAAVRSLIP